MALKKLQNLQKSKFNYFIIVKTFKRNIMKDQNNILLHPEWNHPLIQKLINKVMIKGKKELAEKIVFQALSEIKLRMSQNPYEIAIKAIEITKPYVEVKSIRIAGSTYMVPIEISENRQISLSLKWLVDYARIRGNYKMYQKLALELMDAYNKSGNAIKKKEELHKMAEANRAFSHYRW